MGSRLSELAERLDELASARRAAEDKHGSSIFEEDRALRDSRKLLKGELTAELERQKAEFAEREDRLRRRRRRREEMVKRAYAASRKNVLARLADELDDHQRKLAAVKDRLADVQRAKAGPAAERQARFMAEVASLKVKAICLVDEIGLHAARLDMRLEPVGEIADPDVPCDDDLERVAADTGKALDASAAALRAFRRSVWSFAAQGPYIGTIYFLMVLLHAGGLVFALHLGAGAYALLGLASLLTVGAAVYLLRSAARRRSVFVMPRLHEDAARAVAHLEYLHKEGDERLDPDRFLDEHIDRALAFDKKADAFRKDKNAARKKTLAELDRRHAKLKQKTDSRMGRELRRLRDASSEAETRLKERHRSELSERETGHNERSKAAEQERDETISRLGSEWKELLEGFSAFGREATGRCRAAHPAWSDPTWRDPHRDGGRTLPVDFPAQVPVGTARVELGKLSPDGPEGFPLPGESTITLPVALSFPACGSLFLGAQGRMRRPALSILQNAVLRVLTSFPPGKAKLTIVDPVGLGQNFSALMRLADHDESLVAGRIWTETVHIERRLSDLTEHIEKVIQKYLRNRYATIEEYNREAGAMKEAYRFLVVADFPTGFSDLALERLASIVASGPRCGVFTLIHHDAKQPLPPNIEIAELGRNGLILRGVGERFVAERDGLRRAAFSAEDPPGAELATQLLEAVGQGAQDAERVEVAFASAAPGEGKLWSLSAETGVRVPIGRAGADRLQYLDLGRGTAQHALIGGKTGSGKSTLFHVIITNTALWFSPREVEFYLIDFKKGVEFKSFATGRLPHARVIAIESDREFGLSVLQSINRELSRRGELFRRDGAQDLAGFRRSGAAEHLPRTLLVIDEFQEFFTEDDTIARDAALLLDRFVRQGRAFGIHVLLGSQTLSGIYTLAKSTLGQMGVRIALQCNESDSHLIFSEDNAAARLLTRPGEAIYNDMSGLVEGNNPFQVVWLPDDLEGQYLGRIAARASAGSPEGHETTGPDGRRAREDTWRADGATLVFEGNAPAELEKNAELQALLGRKFAPEDAGRRVWLGEANSIKGPTEVRFSQASGSNLLIVGQHREAAFAMVCSTVVCLAARHGPGELRIVVFNGGGRDEYADQFARLARAVPHGVEIAEPRRIPEIVEELEGRANARDEGGDEGGNKGSDKGSDDGGGDAQQSVYLIVFGVQRLRALRQDDEYIFSASREEGPPTGERFATILREGPERGVHSVVWCDSLGNVNRTFSRKTMREFDMRVLFQMSASDSSELVDESTANNLGLHNALLSIESDGSLEKFRPYTVPDAGYLEDVRRLLLKRF